jgi:lysozyme family protein
MTAFEQAFQWLLGNEGSFVNNPADPGGSTMWGITERVARANGYQGDMQELPVETAEAIAKSQYWDRYSCDQMDPRVAFQVFDIAYNGGYPVLWLQQATGSAPDGVMGPHTLAAVQAADPIKTVMLLNASRIRYYTSLSGWGTFGKGWANRVSDNLKRAAS